MTKLKTFFKEYTGPILTSFFVYALFKLGLHFKYAEDSFLFVMISAMTCGALGAFSYMFWEELVSIENRKTNYDFHPGKFIFYKETDEVAPIFCTKGVDAVAFKMKEPDAKLAKEIDELKHEYEEAIKFTVPELKIAKNDFETMKQMFESHYEFCFCGKLKTNVGFVIEIYTRQNDSIHFFFTANGELDGTGINAKADFKNGGDKALKMDAEKTDPNFVEGETDYIVVGGPEHGIVKKKEAALSDRERLELMADILQDL